MGEDHEGIRLRLKQNSHTYKSLVDSASDCWERPVWVYMLQKGVFHKVKENNIVVVIFNA